MDLSCLSAGGSYTLSDGDAYTLSNGSADGAKSSCTCTKYSYSPGGTPQPTPAHTYSPIPITEDVGPDEESGEEVELPGPEPNTDLFGIQLEVRSILIIYN